MWCTFWVKSVMCPPFLSCSNVEWELTTTDMDFEIEAHYSHVSNYNKNVYAAERTRMNGEEED